MQPQAKNRESPRPAKKPGPVGRKAWAREPWPPRPMAGKAPRAKCSGKRPSRSPWEPGWLSQSGELEEFWGPRIIPIESVPEPPFSQPPSLSTSPQSFSSSLEMSAPRAAKRPSSQGKLPKFEPFLNYFQGISFWRSNLTKNLPLTYTYIIMKFS